MTQAPGLPTVNRPMLKRWVRWKVCTERYGWCFVWADSPAHALSIVEPPTQKEGD